jgi:hypothetical protein
MNNLMIQTHIRTFFFSIKSSQSQIFKYHLKTVKQLKTGCPCKFFLAFLGKKCTNIYTFKKLRNKFIQTLN